jgi:hypothetical protein
MQIPQLPRPWLRNLPVQAAIPNPLRVEGGCYSGRASEQRRPNVLSVLGRQVLHQDEACYAQRPLLLDMEQGRSDRHVWLKGMPANGRKHSTLPAAPNATPA